MLCREPLSEETLFAELLIAESLLTIALPACKFTTPKHSADFSGAIAQIIKNSSAEEFQETLLLQECCCTDLVFLECGATRNAAQDCCELAPSPLVWY